MMWYVYVPNRQTRDALLNVSRNNGWRVDTNKHGPYVSVKDGIIETHANRPDASIVNLSNAFDIFSESPGKKAKYNHPTGEYLGDYLGLSVYLDHGFIIVRYGPGEKQFHSMDLDTAFADLDLEAMTAEYHAAAEAILKNIHWLLRE